MVAIEATNPWSASAELVNPAPPHEKGNRSISSAAAELEAVIQAVRVANCSSVPLGSQLSCRTVLTLSFNVK